MNLTNAVMSLVPNSTVYLTVNSTLMDTLPVTISCRNRYGYHSPSTYNIISCALCFIYVCQNYNVSLDQRTFELVYGTNTVYKEGTRIIADIDKPETVVTVCGSLNDECWKWQECCRQAKICCQDQIAETIVYSKDNTSPLCPRTWDGYACWPDTPAGERPQINCPVYVPMSNTQRRVYKTCTENSTWYTNPYSGIEWTDYTECSQPEHHKRLNTAGIVCNIITIVLLVPACAIFLCYNPLRHQQRIRIHLCLMVSSLLTSVTVLLWEIIVVKDILETHTNKELMPLQDLIECRLLLILSKYHEGTTFLWMFIEGFHLHRLLVRAFSVPKTLVPYYIFGFGFPLLPVTVYSLLMTYSNRESNGCWHEPVNVYDWILYTPSCTAIAMNVIFLLRIVFIMVRQLEPHPNEPSNFRRAVKAVGVLVPLFGIHFLLLIYRSKGNGDLTKLYELFVRIISGLQGTCIAIVFCYFNKEVGDYLKTSCLQLIGRNGRLDVSSRSVTTHSTTDYNRTGMSNGGSESSHMIQLHPVCLVSINEKENANIANEDFISDDLITSPENTEECSLLQPVL